MKKVLFIDRDGTLISNLLLIFKSIAWRNLSFTRKCFNTCLELPKSWNMNW